MKFTTAAQQNIDETGIDPLVDVESIRSGAHTHASLLAHCLDGAEEDRAAGWREYVTTVCEEANDSAVRDREAAMDAKLQATSRGVTPEEAARLQSEVARLAAEAQRAAAASHAAYAAE